MVSGESRDLLLRTARDPAKAATAIAMASALVASDTLLTSRLAILALLRRMVANDSTLSNAHYQIGKIAAITGREPDAGVASLNYYIRHPAASGAPSHAAAYWRIGMIEERRSQIGRARAAYRAALELDPAFAAAREALARIGNVPPSR